MQLKRRTAAVVLATVSASSWLRSQANKQPQPLQCDTPEYFKEFDAFVPGTIIFLSGDGTVRVMSTWPGGPADQAGICPGDQIVAANGVSGSEGKFAEFLAAIKSDKPGPVDLKIRRGTQSLEFRVPRVRESTLAALSGQKYACLPFFPFGARLTTVPLDESVKELQSFRDFEFRLGRHHGFTLAEGHWVPQGTPPNQLSLLAAVLSGSESERLVATLFPYSDARGPDCSFLLLKNPDEVLVGLIEPDSTTFQAGLLPGDEVLEVDGRLVASLDRKRLASLIFKADNRPHPVSLRIRRGTADITVTLETESHKYLGYGFSVFGHAPRPKSSSYVLGIDVVNVEQPRQATVRAVAYPSPAFRAGLLVGDRLTAIDGEPIQQLTAARLSEVLNPTSTSEITLDVSRLGRSLHLRLIPVTEAQAQADIGRKLTANGFASPHCTESARPSS